MNHLTKKLLSALLVLTMIFSLAPMLGIQAEGTWIGDDDLTDQETTAPTPDDVLPDANQYQYQKEELAAFVHFGPNTFNEVEWGESYGSRTPDEIFTLETDFDEEKLVKAIYDAGFKKVIVTAKHHDGFCIWDSAYTDYDVAATSYQDANGQSDILAEISAACTKYDLEMGLYLSPWDIHEPSYGSVDGDAYNYNDYYNNQLAEILGSDKYGNNGHFVEVWMDGAKGSGAYAQEYDFQRWFATIQEHEGKEAGYEADCMLFGAESYTTVRWIGNENGYAHEDTWSKSIIDRENNTINSNSDGTYTIGWEDGNQWTVPESDARITSGWFWGNNKKTPKTVKALGEMYFRSVGHNSPLLLNIPPNNQGSVDDAIVERLLEFGQNIKDTFANNMVVSVMANNVRGNSLTYKPGNTIDGDDATFWTTEDGTSTGQLLLDLGNVRTFDVVSIEEAIQNGQRINSYKVEYQDPATGEWKQIQSGETIGAKRLCRFSAVKAQKLRITVSVPEGKVPMISEVGVYKASKDFELPKAAPDGMEIIDITDARFDCGSGWTDEAGDQFVGGTNKWANAGSELTLSFTGSKVYLVGTLDPNHGTADIYIDGELVETIDTYGENRSLGQIIFTSDDLTDGAHTLRLVVKSKAIGVEAAYVINNGGKGMVGLEFDEYTMNEDQTINVKLVRVGGSTGSVTVQVAPNPGSAIQDDFDSDLVTTVTFAEGETEKYAPVTTRRNTNTTGDRQFTVELSSQTEGLILGFNDVATVTIKDADTVDRSGLKALIDAEEAKGLIGDWFSEGWAEYEAALDNAKEVYDDEYATGSDIQEAMERLTNAAAGLVKRTAYTESDRFQFPWRENASATLEAEFAELKNDPSNDNGWPLQVADRDWASNGQMVDCFHAGDRIWFYYNAEKAGTYTVTASFRSGDSKNGLSWSEESGKIQAGSVTAGANDQAGATHTVTFDVEILEAGEGKWIFTGPEFKSPQLDKLVIVPKTVDRAACDVTVTVNGSGTVTAQDNTITDGTVTVTEGNDQTFTFTPAENFKIVDVKVDGVSVGAVTEYTLTDVREAHTIEVTFALDTYSETDRFQFPTQGSKTLEAELLELTHNEGDEPVWYMQIDEGDWCSGGLFLNAMNAGDYATLYYTAPTAGIYQVTLTFRSGSSSNGFSWEEATGKIQAGFVTAGASDEASTTHTVTFKWLVPTAGDGALTIAALSAGAPQMDKFEITLVEVDKSVLSALIDQAENVDKTLYTAESVEALEEVLAEAKEVFADPIADEAAVEDIALDLSEAIDALVAKPTYTITATAGEGGTITPNGDVSVVEGKSQTFTITPDDGHEVAGVLVDGVAVELTDNTYTFQNVTSDHTISVTFQEQTQERFQFPTTVGTTVTMEAEIMELHNSGVGEQWPLQLSQATWASGGVFVNAMNTGDSGTIYYYAEKAGTYEVILTFRSGDPANSLSWTEADGKITTGSVVAGANDSATATHTVTFQWVVEEAGAGALTIKAGDRNAPQMDKFDITLLSTPCGHEDITHVEDESATCTEAGNIEYWHCADCDKYFSNADATQEIKKAETVIDAKGHTEEVVSGKDATCTEPGLTDGKKCSTCGQVLEAQQEISPTGHQHTEIRGAKEATCTEDGYTGDTYCTDCNEKIADGTVIDATGHQHTEIRGAKEATCTEDGYTGDTYCTDCNEKIATGEAISATGHHYEDGVCTDCGEEDPDYVEPSQPSQPSEPTQPSESTDPTDPGVPGTGDLGMIPVFILVIALAATALVVVLKKKTV